jgi:hypothetical protein
MTTTTPTTVTVQHLDDDGTLHPLYCHYQGQTRPQTAHIEIDYEERTISAAVNGVIGNGIPMSIWNGRVGRFSVDRNLTLDEINELLDDLAEHAATLCDNYAEGGGIDNDLAHKLESVCYGIYTDSLGVIDASEWYAESGDDPLEDIAATGGDIEAAAMRVAAIARSLNCTVTGLEEYLTEAQEDGR